MDAFFKSLLLLPWYMQITTILLLIVVIVIRDKAINYIKDNFKNIFNKNKDTDTNAQISNKKKFTREEVMGLLFDNTESCIHRMHMDIHEINKKRLELQMTLGDQALDGFLSLLNDSFSTQMKEKEIELKSQNIKIDPLRVIEQKQTYNVITKLILDSYVRNELRRIFKYNGFHELEGEDWENYKFTKFQSIINILLNKLTSEYPNTMYLPFSDYKAYILENNKRDMRNIFSDMMDNVKSKYLKSDNKIKDIKQRAKAEIQQNKDQLGI